MVIQYICPGAVPNESKFFFPVASRSSGAISNQHKNSEDMERQLKLSTNS